VVAKRQTGGRGRYGRKFVSDEGGMWLSAVVPTPGGPQAWVGYALAVGWALLCYLRNIGGGLPTARLRWPNDILVEERKLAGILLEQPNERECIVGIGLNVRNDLTCAEGDLARTAIRLADCIAPQILPSLEELVEGTLDAIRYSWERFSMGGLAGLKDEINGCWGRMRRVRLELADGKVVEGVMVGIDEVGAILVSGDEGTDSYAAHKVKQLFEVE
ncbi:MAG: biotin--[acetyl-CoA-carboxylase] ligase, partial [Chthoniobacterales bacterium]|nr:biotin--[acetyl-CoA-carboxylase] ligase [Chthoniobacterales bacterium]